MNARIEPVTSEAATDSKTAPLAASHVRPDAGTRMLDRYAQLRAVLRSEVVNQSGVESAPVEQRDPMQASIFFLDGEEHKRRRAAIVPLFTPKAIATRHLPKIQAHTDALIARFRQTGEARIDELSLWLTGAVVADVLGLAESDLEGLARRIAGSSRAGMAQRGGIWKLIAAFLARWYGFQVLVRDVRPAIAARRQQRRDDVISRLLDEGRNETEVLIECMTFGLAGMGTTREFIVVAAWHFFERPELRQRFLDGDDAAKTAILMELLRLEPVASMIYRGFKQDLPGDNPDALTAGTRVSLNIRAANLDAEGVGPDPTRIDPDRAKKLKANGAWMSFGDGDHFCPGWQLALVEARIFLDSFLRVPGLKLVRQPDIIWVPPMLQSYEMRGAVVTCDRA